MGGKSSKNKASSLRVGGQESKPKWRGCPVTKPHLCAERLCGQRWLEFVPLFLTNISLDRSTPAFFNQADLVRRYWGYDVPLSPFQLHLLLTHDSEFRSLLHEHLSREFCQENMGFLSRWVELLITHGPWVAMYTSNGELQHESTATSLYTTNHSIPACTSCASVLWPQGNKPPSTAPAAGLLSAMRELVDDVMDIREEFVGSDSPWCVAYSAHRYEEINECLVLLGVELDEDGGGTQWMTRRQKGGVAAAATAPAAALNGTTEEKGQATATAVPRDIFESVLTATTICRSRGQRDKYEENFGSRVEAPRRSCALPTDVQESAAGPTSMVDASAVQTGPLPFSAAECGSLLHVFDALAMDLLRLIQRDSLFRFVHTEGAAKLINSSSSNMSTASLCCSTPVISNDPLLMHCPTDAGGMGRPTFPLPRELWSIVLSYTFHPLLWGSANSTGTATAKERDS